MCPTEGARTGAGLGYVQIRQDRPQEHIGAIWGDDAQAMPPPPAHARQLGGGQLRNGVVVRAGDKMVVWMLLRQPIDNGLQAPPQDQMIVLPPAVEGEVAGGIPSVVGEGPHQDRLGPRTEGL